jgi:hypothetical protein
MNGLKYRLAGIELFIKIWRKPVEKSENNRWKRHPVWLAVRCYFFEQK